ncbi:mercuric reductase [Chitinophaga sp. sic0106]|uniref:mercuric reductase n=1 Tax=Chitinophaga sp. sic0106 TaxID=2854785 RepID=UPI001C462EA0|nr:mercuric reductase [Chitinophaga sp. sic0106]MBV7532578.1 mercuric reductase [Chitinophaga sp. sic0106]
MEKFDAIIIGSGQGGNPLARKLAKKGLKTAIIEKRLIGGTCINDGCTPTKSMIACAKAAQTVRQAAQWGVHLDQQSISIDLPFIIERKNKVVTQFRNGTIRSLESEPNITIYYGTASFAGVKKVNITQPDDQVMSIEANNIFINTGADTIIPEIPGLSEIHYLTSTTILDIKEIPPELIVLGGSYIGLEMGQLFQRLGSKVSIIEPGPHLMSREDTDVAAVVKNMLEAEGMTIHTSSKPDKISSADNIISLDIVSGTSRKTITGTHLLVATGRRPQSAELQLSNTNVTTDEKGFIQVNDQLETTCPGIYAMGDVKPGPAFTHISYNDHLLLYKNLFENTQLTTKTRQIPYCMFTDPQLGRIGLSEKEAADKGYPFKVACLGMDKVARAIETGQTTGFMKAIVHAATDKILGAAIIGEQGGEIMSVVQMAMAGDLSATQLREMIFAHPLYAESINNLFMTLEK